MTTIKFSISSLAMTVMTVLGLAAFAADDSFPNSDGSGNLLSAAAWGGTVSTNRMKLTAGGTYYADPNGTINGLVIGTTGVITLDQTQSTQAKPLVTMGAGFDIGGNGRRVTFKGGTYDFQGRFGFAYGGYNSYYNNNILFDGCVFTNLTGELSQTYNGTTLSTWTLENNAAIYTSGDFKPDHYGNGKTRVIITGGSRIVASGIFQMGRRNNGDQGNVDQKVYVTGAGSLLRFGNSTSASCLSCSFSDALLEASAGGRIEAVGSKEFIIGQMATASNNVVRATGAGTVITINNACYGYSSAAHHNRIECLDDAEVDCSYITIKDGVGNGLICSNGTVMITQYQIVSATNTLFRLSGDHPKMQLSIAGKQYSLKRGSRLVFDLPPTGYNYANADDCPLVSYAQSDAIDDTTVVEINGIEDYKTWMAAHRIHRSKIKLAYLNCSAYWGHISSERLARWNAALPEGAVLSTPVASAASDRGRTLYLTITAKLGTTILFR